MMWKSLQMPRSFQKVESSEDGRKAKFVVEALERGWGRSVTLSAVCFFPPCRVRQSSP